MLKLDAGRSLGLERVRFTERLPSASDQLHPADSVRTWPPRSVHTAPHRRDAPTSTVCSSPAPANTSSPRLPTATQRRRFRDRAHADVPDRAHHVLDERRASPNTAVRWLRGDIYRYRIELR